MTGVHVFTRDTTADPKRTAIVFIRCNDVTFGMKDPKAMLWGVQHVVEWLTPQVKPIMVIGLTTGTNEPSGPANHTTITEINDRL